MSELVKAVESENQPRKTAEIQKVLSNIQNQPIAFAFVESTSGSWKWHLKVDSRGLYRWYKDGVIETDLRGVTQQQAEKSLYQFVLHSMRGELQIKATIRFALDG
jgi:hypothetical protein